MISGSQGSDHENYYLLGCLALYFHGNSLIFRDAYCLHRQYENRHEDGGSRNL
jgi:hypothetical protein